MQCLFAPRAARPPLSLCSACAAGDLEAVEAALAAGDKADAPDVRTGDTPLLAACWRGSADVVAALLAAGASASLADARGQTPLHAACAQRRSAAAVVALLLARGADANAATRADARTPLHNACEYAAPEAAALLVAAGARPCARTRSGASPLSLARARGDEATRGRLVALLAPLTPAGLGDGARRSALHCGAVDERGGGMALGQLHC